jgi:AmmeMemoRadiSam system protein A
MSPQNLNLEEQKWLLALARRAISEKLVGVSLDLELIGSELPSDALRQPAGAFVTLHVGGKLRGCIGYIEPKLPLFLTVAEGALAAAFRDPRFPPLREEELGSLEFEISVLSPVFPIEAGDVEVGKHGLMVTAVGQRGLLLPQVPVEQGWDRERFIEETCVKAGLPRTAWKEGATLSVFTAQIFSEKTVPAT